VFVVRVLCVCGVVSIVVSFHWKRRVVDVDERVIVSENCVDNGQRNWDRRRR